MPAPLRVIYAADSAFARHLAASARSLTANHPGPIEVLVLSCGLTIADKELIRHHAITPATDCSVSFIEIGHHDLAEFTLDTTIKIVDHLSTATFARLILDQVVNLSGRALYLDADTIVVGSLHELWEADLDGCALGAVTDPLVKRLGHRLGVQRRDLTNAPRRAGYFNAGVLLFDMDKLREDRVFEAARAYLLEAAEHVVLYDQEALNAAIGGRYKKLAPEWNVMSNDPKLPWRQRHARIRHFSAPKKPWTHPNHDTDASLYFDYAPRTSSALHAVSSGRR